MKVNLGSGPHLLHGWINVDLGYPELAVKGLIPIDLSKGSLPWSDGVADFIYSEHFIEHIKRPQALTLMRECYRILRPGGVMRISTPDLWVLINHYNKRKLICLPGVWEPPTLCQMLNGGLHEWGHQFVYDIDEMFNLLIEAGFSHDSIKRKSWRESDYADLSGREVRPFFNEIIVEVTR